MFAAKDEYEKDLTSVRTQYEEKMSWVLGELKRKKSITCATETNSVTDAQVNDLQQQLTQALESLQEKVKPNSTLIRGKPSHNHVHVIICRREKSKARKRPFLVCNP